MITCSNCGADNREDAKFCNNCGAPLYSVKGRERREEACFGQDRRDTDWLGLVSFGFFIIIVGIVIVVNPDVFSNIRSWIDQLTNQRAWIRPPQGLINSATLFFALIGLDSFLMAGIRFVVDKDSRRSLSEVLSGVAFVLLAYLLNLYSSYVLRLRIGLAIEIVVCGSLVIIYVVARYILPRAR
jgi:hypothetical protein